jgi:hypothetical protein
MTEGENNIWLAFELEVVFVPFALAEALETDLSAAKEVTLAVVTSNEVKQSKTAAHHCRSAMAH